MEGGTDNQRGVEQWLNGTYSDRENFALLPCDGLFSRAIQTAVLYGLQYEFGMDDDTANGNFGPGTRSGLQTQAPVFQGDADSTHHFVHLFRGLLRFNSYDDTTSGIGYVRSVTSTWNSSSGQNWAPYFTDDMKTLKDATNGDW